MSVCLITFAIYNRVFGAHSFVASVSVSPAAAAAQLDRAGSSRTRRRDDEVQVDAEFRRGQAGRAVSHMPRAGAARRRQCIGDDGASGRRKRWQVARVGSLDAAGATVGTFGPGGTGQTHHRHRSPALPASGPSRGAAARSAGGGWPRPARLACRVAPRRRAAFMDRQVLLAAQSCPQGARGFSGP